MTEEELARIEKITDAATPGPWNDEVGVVVGHDKRLIFHVLSTRGDFDEEVCNSYFAVEARTAVPALITEVRRLQSDNRDLIAALEDQLEIECPDPDCFVCNSQKPARAAIAKAKVGLK